MSKYCPNCVTEMSKEKKKLGKVTEWYKCPSCGVREEVVDPITEQMQSEAEQKKILKQKKRDARGYYDSEGNNTY